MAARYLGNAAGKKGARVFLKMREVNSDSGIGLMGGTLEVRTWRKRKEKERGVGEGGGSGRMEPSRKERGKGKCAARTGEYRIGLSVESIKSRGGSLNCLCLFRKQRSAAVHQNGRSPSVDDV